MENRERLTILNRRYKTYKVLKHVLLIISIAVAIIPAIWVAFKVAPSLPRVKPAAMVASFALFILAIGLILIIRGLEKRYAHSLPWAMSTLLGAWALYCFLYAIEKVIVQGVQVALALAVGASVAFVLSLGSELCRVLERSAREEYERLK